MSESRRQDLRPWVPQIAAVAMLLVPTVRVFENLPEGYFTLLRIVVSGWSSYLALYMYGMRLMNTMWALVALAIIFNPIRPVELDKDLWWYVDIAAAGILYWGFFHLRGAPVFQGTPGTAQIEADSAAVGAPKRPEMAPEPGSGFFSARAMRFSIGGFALLACALVGVSPEFAITVLLGGVAGCVILHAATHLSPEATPPFKPAEDLSPKQNIMTGLGAPKKTSDEFCGPDGIDPQDQP